MDNTNLILLKAFTAASYLLKNADEKGDETAARMYKRYAAYTMRHFGLNVSLMFYF